MKGGTLVQYRPLIRHQALAEHRPGLEQRSQILDELTGERVADDRHSHGTRDWPSWLDAEFREHRFTSSDEFADLDHGVLPFMLCDVMYRTGRQITPSRTMRS